MRRSAMTLLATVVQRHAQEARPVCRYPVRPFVARVEYTANLIARGFCDAEVHDDREGLRESRAAAS
jgi:hypothetical protein